ncbi:MAG: alkaline phosphatase family protein, partial [Deltaproteobacteria bacterium]|nr:alkaline phosphatase family protein [Deltaproteobacteria bacterium]
VPFMTRGRRAIEKEMPGTGPLYSSIAAFESGGIRMRLHQTHPNDGILLLQGPVSPFISDSDPMVEGRPVARIVPLAGNPEPERAGRTAAALNDYLRYAHRVLKELEPNPGRRAGGLPEANFLVTLRCGRRAPQQPFEERWGLKGLFISSGAVFAGLARELGLRFQKAEKALDPEDEIRQRIRSALEDREHDFVHVHTKAPDEAAHTGDPLFKAQVLNSLDRGMDDLLEALEERDDLLVAVTGDHSTPSLSPLIHSGEPVPLLLAGRTVRRDGVRTFDEVSAATGSLGYLKGKELMLTLLNHADRSTLFGHRLGRVERPYFPEHYEPFTLGDE